MLAWPAGRAWVGWIGDVGGVGEVGGMIFVPYSLSPVPYHPFPTSDLQIPNSIKVLKTLATRRFRQGFHPVDSIR